MKVWRIRHIFKIKLSWCNCCNKQCLWLYGKLIVPDSGDAPLPNEDLSDGIKADYMEAASVLQKSPRAAAALLRLALQKLCKQLGGKGKHIQAGHWPAGERKRVVRPRGGCDGLRFALSATTPCIRGNWTWRRRETATILFDLINFIAETMLTEPKKRKAFYESVAGFQEME